jgi:hypothetical protein
MTSNQEAKLLIKNNFKLDTYLPIDGWTEEAVPQLKREFDTHIQMLTPLKGVEAYELRRLLMISLRQMLLEKFK